MRADARGVQVGERWIPRAEIREGFIMPDAAPKVPLRRRSLRLPVEIEVGSTAEGRAMLRALGLDASQTVANFRALSQTFAKPGYLVTAGVAIPP